MLCRWCHTPNPPGARICGACGAPLIMPMGENFAVGSMWSLEQSSAVLQNAITEYLDRGFGVVSRTTTTAHLLKQRGIKGPAALILFLVSLFGGAGMGFHLFVSYNHLLKDQSVYLFVDDVGHLYTWVAEAQEAGADPRRILALTVVLVITSVVVIYGAFLLSRMLSTVWGIR